MEKPRLFTVNTDPEAITIGLIYVCLSSFMIPFYFVFNWVMWRDKEIKRVPIYRIMNQINLIDFGQLICHFISGFFPIFPEIIHSSRFFSSFVGSTVNSLWQAMFPYFCVLSISRILIIRKKMDPNHLSWSLQGFIIFGWLFTITVWLWSWLGMSFVFGSIAWEYDFTMWSSRYLQVIEIAWCWPAIVICYLMYVGIIVHLLMSKKYGGATRTSRKQEIAIFCQATFLNGWMFGLMAAWHNSERLGLTKNYQKCIINCVWILFSYLNPILLLALNKTIRAKILAFVLANHTSHVSSVKSRPNMAVSTTTV